MTENKRFGVINISKNGMKGLFKLGNDNLSVYDVARLLNELLEENEQLKHDATVLIQANQDYRRENEQLKDALNQRTEQCDKYYGGHEQLKHFIQELTTKGTAKIHLANGSIYNVNAILTDFKGDFE